MTDKRHVAARPVASAIAILTAAAAGGSPWLAPRAAAAGPRPIPAASAAREPDADTLAEARRVLGAQPMRFEASDDPAAAYVAGGAGHRVALGARSAAVALGGAAVTLRFVGGDAARPEAADRLPGVTNYLTGPSAESWRTGVAGYGRVLYADLFPGVSASFSGAAGRVDLDLEIAPGAGADRVVFALDGAASARLLEGGDIAVETPGGTITLLAPTASQESDAGRVPVESAFVLRGAALGIRLGAHDASKAVRVGVSLAGTTAPPPSGADEGWKVATDASGAIYVAGVTGSPAFPSAGGAQTALKGDSDGFLTKLSPTGQLLSSTFLGGTKDDAVHGLALDAQRNVYLVGSTNSKDFPVLNAVQPANRSACRNCYDAFVTKLTPSGSAILFSTYLGGAESEDGNAVAVDPSGNVTVTGATNSPDFPTANAVQPVFAGGGDCGYPCPDAWAAKLTATGSQLLYATYVGGEGFDAATDVAVDAAGNAYLTGITFSPSFPVANALQPTLAGEHDGFVTEVAANGASLVYSTYLGGAGYDSGGGIVVDAAGAAFVAGYSYSLDFPAVGALQTANAGTFRTTDGAAQWSAVNAGLERDFNFLAVAVDPADAGVVYLGSSHNGVFKSTDGGATWGPSNAGMTGREVSGVAVAPSSPSTVYAATTAGVEKSLDAGATWSLAAEGLPPYVQSVVVAPDDPGVVYAATAIAGVFKSVDGGGSWAPAQDGIVDSVYQLAVDPSDPKTLYASSAGQMFKSTDGGASWIGNAGGLPAAAIYAVAVDPSDTSVVYAGSAGAGVFKSTDGGGTWARVTGGLATGVVTSIAVDPSNPSVVYAGSQGDRSFRINKRGGSKADEGPAGVAFGRVRPAPAGRPAAGGPPDTAAGEAKGAPAANTNGGVFKSADGGQTWSIVNAGLRSSGVAAIAVAPSSPSTVFAATYARGDATLTALAPGGGSIAYSTYLGGSDTDEARAVARDAAGNVYLAGITYSTDFPTVSPVQATVGPNFWGDGFAARLNASGTAVTGATYLGGRDDDALTSVAVDPSGAAVVTGHTWSFDFPLAGARQPLFGAGGTDAVVSKIPASFGAFAFSTYLGGYSDTPYVSGATFFKGGLLVEGSFFSPGAVVLVNGVAQATAIFPDAPSTVLLVPRVSVKLGRGSAARIQVRNANRTLSNAITVTVP